MRHARLLVIATLLAPSLARADITAGGSIRPDTAQVNGVSNTALFNFRCLADITLQQGAFFRIVFEGPNAVLMDSATLFTNSLAVVPGDFGAPTLNSNVVTFTYGAGGDHLFAASEVISIRAVFHTAVPTAFGTTVRFVTK